MNTGKLVIQLKLQWRVLLLLTVVFFGVNDK